MKKLATATAIAVIVLSQATSILAKDGSENLTSSSAPTATAETSSPNPSGIEQPKPTNPPALRLLEGGGILTQNEAEIKQKEADFNKRLESEKEVEKEKTASRSAELKVRLQAFRNQQKATLAQKVSDTLNMINQKQTSSMLKILDKMSSILDKIETLSKEASGSAQLANAQTAIATARTSVADTKNAALAQQAKDYTLVVSSESAVKNNAQADRNSLKNDLEALRQQVIATKQTVAAAAKATALAIGGNGNE